MALAEMTDREKFLFDLQGFLVVPGFLSQDELDCLNTAVDASVDRRGEDGKRLVRIHGVGFPVQFANPPQYQDTGIKFAILMRQLCAQHDGTFVALNRFR